jgi:hypothetical protein
MLGKPGCFCFIGIFLFVLLSGGTHRHLFLAREEWIGTYVFMMSEIQYGEYSIFESQLSFGKSLIRQTLRNQMIKTIIIGCMVMEVCSCMTI